MQEKDAKKNNIIAASKFLADPMRTPVCRPVEFNSQLMNIKMLYLKIFPIPSINSVLKTIFPYKSRRKCY